MSGESNNFGTIIKQLVNDIMMDFFLTYSPKPGKMIDFDFKKRTATILPLIEPQSFNGKIVEQQPISDVPVIIPASKKCELSIPFDIEAGEEGWLLPTYVSFGTWYSNGDLQQENFADRGAHNCVFLPNVLNSLMQNEHIDNGDDYIRYFAGNSLRFKKDGGTNLIGNEIDIFAKIISLTDKIATLSDKLATGFNALATAQYGAVPGPTTCATELQGLKTEIDAIKSDIGQIKNDLNTSQGN